MLAYLIVFGCGLRTAFKAVDEYGAYLAIGITMFIGLQAFTNLAVAMGMLPTKGLVLPFISYGGSSLLVNSAAVGVLLNVRDRVSPRSPRRSRERGPGEVRARARAATGRNGMTIRSIIVAGGGTGGHLFPGIAVVEELRRRIPDLEVTFVGTERGIEARVLPERGERLELIEVTPLKGRTASELMRSLMRLPGAMSRASGLISKYAPDLVIGVGGYAAGPMLLAAAARGVPTAILEQNAHVGLTNRLLAPIAGRAYVAFEEAAEQIGGRLASSATPSVAHSWRRRAPRRRTPKASRRARAACSCSAGARARRRSTRTSRPPSPGSASRSGASTCCTRPASRCAPRSRRATLSSASMPRSSASSTTWRGRTRRRRS